MSAPAAAAGRHVKMVFRFENLGPAEDLRAALAERNLPAAATFYRGAWEVYTDTRCLEHAPALVNLIGGAQ